MNYFIYDLVMIGFIFGMTLVIEGLWTIIITIYYAIKRRKSCK